MTEKQGAPSAMPEDEYQRGQATQQFIDQAVQIEEAREQFPTTLHATVGDQGEVAIKPGKNMDSRGGLYAPRTGGWPQERVNGLVKQLSEVPGSGLDYGAIQKIDKLKEKAAKENKAFDTIMSQGKDLNLYNSDENIERVKKGNNSIGMDPNLGAMARGAGRKYDIKNGVAMRGRSSAMPDRNGNLGVTAMTHDPAKGELRGLKAVVAGDGEYVPFAPQQQERAKKAMQALAEKQKTRAQEAERQKEVQAAKAVLGRAGIKIPKPNSDRGNSEPQPLDAQAA